MGDAGAGRRTRPSRRLLRDRQHLDRLAPRLRPLDPRPPRGPPLRPLLDHRRGHPVDRPRVGLPADARRRRAPRGRTAAGADAGPPGSGARRDAAARRRPQRPVAARGNGARGALPVRGADPLLPQAGARDPAARAGGGVDLPPAPRAGRPAMAARDRRADGAGRQPPRRHPGGASPARRPARRRVAAVAVDPARPPADRLRGARTRGRCRRAAAQPLRLAALSGAGRDRPLGRPAPHSQPGVDLADLLRRAAALRRDWRWLSCCSASASGASPAGRCS